MTTKEQSLERRFYTSENPPRQINVLGRSAITPDVLVAENPDGGRAIWIVDGGDLTKPVCHVCGADYKAIRFPPSLKETSNDLK